MWLGVVGSVRKWMVLMLLKIGNFDAICYVGWFKQDKIPDNNNLLLSMKGFVVKYINSMLRFRITKPR